MKKCKVRHIILYGINFILIGFIILSNTGTILDNNKVILKSMNESAEVTNLNNTINTLQASHTEYATKIQTHKINLATAITNAGVSTSGDATFETMITNVSNIISNKTNDATATEGQILTGKTAYVKGNKITGTMADRGTLNWNPSSSTSYTVPSGYYSGGTISTSNAYNAGVTAADNRVNANSTNYITGYNNGYNDGKNNTQFYATSFIMPLSGSVNIPITLSNTPNFICITSSPSGTSWVNHIYDGTFNQNLVKSSYYATSQTVAYSNRADIFSQISKSNITVTSNARGATGFAEKTWHIVVGVL